MTVTKLIMFPIRWRQAKPRKPVAAIVMQVMGDFIPEVFQDPMFHDVISVGLCGFGTPYSFAQGSISIVFAVVGTAMQRMRHPVRSLCPPPDIALESIC
jgi:hypothetical protein